MKSFALICFVAFCIFNPTLARIVSIGNRTALSVRSQFKDSDFVINPEKGIAIDTADLRIRIADTGRFPVLGAPDVQSMVIEAKVKGGRPFFDHYHPRGSETFTATRGKFKVLIQYEGLSPRTVTFFLKAGESTVFPTGLSHGFACVSKKNCAFLAIFNTADPGLIPTTI